MYVRVLCCVSAKDDDSCCDDENLVRIFADGSCVWARQFQLSVTHCPMDITWFPFDQQSCDLIFESKTRPTSELDFVPVAPEWMLTLYKSSGEWALLGTSISCCR